jgi:hypothetical protein
MEPRHCTTGFYISQFADWLLSSVPGVPMGPGLTLDSRIIAEYQFDQRHNEREVVVSLIRVTHD